MQNSDASSEKIVVVGGGGHVGLPLPLQRYDVVIGISPTKFPFRAISNED